MSDTTKHEWKFRYETTTRELHVFCSQTNNMADLRNSNYAWWFKFSIDETTTWTAVARYCCAFVCDSITNFRLLPRFVLVSSSSTTNPALILTVAWIGWILRKFMIKNRKHKELVDLWQLKSGRQYWWVVRKEEIERIRMNEKEKSWLCQCSGFCRLT